MNGMAAFDITSHGDTSDSCIDFCCYFCEENDVKMKADFFCERCSKCYCSGCIEQHRHIFKKHVGVYGRGEMDSWPEMPVIVAALERCENHADRKLELYCEDHRKLLCHICLLQNHRSCRSVLLITDKVKGRPVPDDASVKNIVDKLASLQTTLEHKKQAIENDVLSMQHSYDEVRKKVKTSSISIIRTVRKMKNDTLRELETIHSDLKERLHSYISICNKLDNKLQQFIQNIESIRNVGTELSFISYRKSLELKSETDSVLDKFDINGDDNINFIPDPNIERYLATISGLGKLFISKVNQPHTGFDANGILSVESNARYNVKLKSDTNVCSVRGTCEMPSGEFVIADTNNMNVKLLDKTFSVITDFTLPAQPLDVIHIMDRQIAVSLNSQSIYLLQVNNDHIENDRPLILGHECRGIAHHGDNLYVASGTALYQYTMDGQRTKVLYEDITDAKDTVGCAVSPGGDKLYVTNPRRGTLVTLSSSGDILATLREPTLTSSVLVPGLHVTGAGHVLIYGYDSNCILQVDTSGGRVLSTLATMHDNVSYPRSVYYSERMAALVVGMWDDAILILKTSMKK